ncbi:MAG TPA: type II toxin-antitoxin system HicB family antitoxin, partial [Ktedonobacterales bacterium]|nr:type II toxin-antitoxin system HicB family antitoxin [Ktedonobacterales bacterium]
LARCPLLERHGGATWGHTRDEALRNIDDVIRMVIDSLTEHGDPIPDSPHASGGLVVTVTVESPSPTVHGD